MSIKKTQAKNVLVTGYFDVLHPGHIRLLKFAKECGDKLIVAVYSDQQIEKNCRVNQTHRLEVIQSLECVDECFITDLSPVELVKKYQPYAVIKGKEFEFQPNAEHDELHKYGGKLIFGSGEFETSTDQFIKSHHQVGLGFEYDELKSYAARRNIKQQDLIPIFENMCTLNVGVIGEVIVDEYIQGNAVGLSQEDPTIVMTPSRIDTFLGGAAITAGHIKSIGANNVTLFSVLGADNKADYCKSNIANYKINTFFVEDASRPTPLKTRYRVDKKTLLRVNQVRQHKISEELQDSLYSAINQQISTLDILVFSDFNYGLLPQTLVEKIIALCEKHSVKVVADSQTSSQVGDISRYKNTLLMTPTEKEVRVALNNSDDGLVVLSNKLCEKSSPKNLVITLASEGVFIHIPTVDKTSWDNDKIPALNKNASDPAGAGDCFLATSTLSLAAGASPWQAFYIASIAAACQVDTIGNSPLSQTTLIKNIENSFK
jgi:rfaE bifunctional protein kinase chain/domain